MNRESLTFSNRRQFMSELANRLRTEGESACGPLTVVLARVQRLREINAELGFDIGDLVIAQAGSRIQSCLRASDIIASVGNNEFALILSNNTPAQLESAVARYIARCREPLIIEGKRLRMRIACGIAYANEHGNTASELMCAADTALVEARNRTCGYAVFKAAPSSVATPATMEFELEEGISRGDIQVCYQPKIELATGSVAGAECLARWTSPTAGPVRPDIFIEIAERTGLIIPLTISTLNSALRQAREWPSVNGKLVPAVNLSAQVLSDGQAVDLLIETADRWEVEPGSLTLEVTESAMMADPDQSLKALRRLHERGIVLSVDDFGTGYSSLAYLKKIPLNELKIDKSFVLDMVEDRDDSKIVKAVIDLAHNFNLKVVAEGVETEMVMHMLTAMGSDFAQGFLFGKPMTSADLIQWLQRPHWTNDNAARGSKAANG